jgi:hypothetical protein
MYSSPSKQVELQRKMKHRRWLRENGAPWLALHHQESFTLKETIQDHVARMADPWLYVSGRAIDRLERLKLRLIVSNGRLCLSCDGSAMIIRGTVVAAKPDAFGALAIEVRNSKDVELIELRPGNSPLLRGHWKTCRRQFQLEVESAIDRYFSRVRILHSVVHSDLQHSISGRYVRLRFLASDSEWHAVAVGPEENQATVDGILTAALLWRDFVREETGRRVSRLLLIVPSDRLLVLRSRLGWIRPWGSQIHLLGFCSNTRNLVRETPEGPHGLDVAITRVEPAGKPRASWVPENLSCERQLERLLLEDILLISPDFNPQHFYPQVPAFLGLDRGVIDLLGVNRQGRLVVLELKVDEDLDLPMQGLDYWLRVQWHHRRLEFKNHGYFPNIELSQDPPLLFFVSPQFRFHDTFPRIIRCFHPSVPVVQIGLNEDWKHGLRVVLRRVLSGESDRLLSSVRIESNP